MTYILSFLCLLASVYGAPISQETQEIQIQLPTSSALTPLYIGRLQNQNASFDASYLNELDATMQYDLRHNGFTSLVPRTSDKEGAPLNGPIWKKVGIPHVVQWKISQRTIQLSTYSTQSGSLKQFPEVVLTGHIAQDRRLIHKLADAVQKALFNVEGVAGSPILYSYQVKSPRSDGKEWYSEIWECDWDGQNPRQVTHDGSYCVTPVFLPTSSRFLYVSYKQSQPKIFIASVKDGVGKRLVDLGGNQMLPAVSPKRDKIAFICDAGGRTDLFIQHIHPETGETGRPVQLFSYPRSTQASPTFSPDGSKIAFVSDKDGAMRIYTIPSAVTESRANAVLLTKQNKENSCPAWSPDGKKLAYSAKTNGIRQIWIYDFDTKEERQLTAGPGNKENPSWGADSIHLVFNTTDGTSSDLFIANLNQPEAIKITKGPGKKHYPSWGSR